MQNPVHWAQIQGGDSSHTMHFSSPADTTLWYVFQGPSHYVSTAGTGRPLPSTSLLLPKREAAEDSEVPEVGQVPG